MGMKMNAKSVDVETVFKDVQSMCRMMVLQNPDMLYTNDVFSIIDKCRYFSRLYDMRKQNLTSEERFCNECYEEKEDTLEEAITKAYHSAVLFDDAVHGEELYFLKEKQSTLLDWNPQVSPYSDLQKVRLKFFLKQDIRLSDVILLFEELRKTLQLDISAEMRLKKIRAIFQRMEMKHL